MKHQTIPVIFDEKSFNAPQYSSIIQGIRAAATRSSVRLSLVSDKDFEKLKIDQLPPIAVVTGSNMPFIREVLAALSNHGKKALLSGSDSDQFGEGFFCVTPSRRAETQQMVNYLFKCGKQRIALVGFGVNSINDNFRYHAAMSAVAACGIPMSYKDAWLWQNDPKEIFDDFLDVCQRYDAVLCPNDVMAVCLLNVCAKRGINVPRDLFVASFGNMAIGRYYRPSITSMTMDMLRVGEQTFHLWRFLMTNANARENAFRATVPSRILVRETTMNLTIGTDAQIVSPSSASGVMEVDRFYDNKMIAELVGIEKCIIQRDQVDMRIVAGLMDGQSYEQICDELFISSSTLRYRLNKIYADVGVKKRKEFEELMRSHLGSGNPFRNCASDFCGD